MRLDELFDLEELGMEVFGGRVVKKEHPTLPLSILKYSKTCPFSKNPWTQVTSNCRGLIYNEETLEIVSRGWPKFHNYGQKEAPEWKLSEPVFAMDKVDGSAGLLYRYDNQLYISTLGSFTSTQAKFATELLNTKYADWCKKYLEADNFGFSILFEIVFPENRVVVDYGDMKDLVLIGGVTIEHGAAIIPGALKNVIEWPGPVVQMFPEHTLGEVLKRGPRKNAEGIVIGSLISGELVKLKQDDYLALHKAKFGLSARRVWECVVEGLTLQEVLSLFPDEFADWIRGKYEDIYTAGAIPVIEAQNIYQEIREEFGELDKKQFAEQALKHPKHQSFLFMLYNNVPTGRIYLSSFKKNKPKHEPMKEEFNA